jgi:hypothetical protein
VYLFYRLVTISLFKNAPLSFSLLFPFGTLGEEMFQSAEFQDAVRTCTYTLDFAVSSLGPDLDVLFGQLVEICLEYENFSRVRSCHWAVMETALISALEETLGDRFDTETKDAWVSVFSAISQEMIAVIKPRKTEGPSAEPGTVIPR